MRTHVWALALLALGGFGLSAQAQTKLAWKFTEGEKFYTEEISDNKQQISIMGQDIKMATKTTNITSYTVKRVAGGAVTMEMKVEHMEVKADNNMFGGGMEKMQEKMQGATFTFTLDGGKVTKFSGHEEFLKRLSDGDEMIAKFGKMIFTEDLLKKGVEEAFTNLPTRAVNRGDKWNKDKTLPMGPLGNIKMKNEYTYKGDEADGSLLTYTGTLNWQAPKEGAGFGDLFKISKANFKSDNVRGSIVFDAKAGRLVRSSNSMTMSGTMTIDVMGNELEMSMTQDTTSTLRVLRKNPKDN
jgi:hypothetical protein